MQKITRILICLMAISLSSMFILNPQNVWSKQNVKKEQKKENVVYVTKNGKRYHKKTCPFIKNRQVTSMNEKEAIGKGLKPCGRCFKQKK